MEINACPHLRVKVVANFQMPSTVGAAHTNVACKHFFGPSSQGEKLRTERCALARVQKLFQAVQIN